jgi:hypothetical protein
VKPPLPELQLQVFLWSAADLENRLHNYQAYNNEDRTHSGRNGETPVESADKKVLPVV